MDTMKTFFLVIGIFCFLHFLVPGVSAVDPLATLQLEGGEAYYTDSDTITPGIYPLQYTNSISTLVSTPNTTISNVTYSLGADNMDHVIWVGDSQYATRNSTDITWVYPQSLEIKPGNYHLVSIKTDFYSNQYIPMTLSRTMNKTLFSEEGYQKASFFVSFENITYTSDGRLCDFIWTGINAAEDQNLNASMLLDTFSTDAPGHVYSDNKIHSFQFAWNKSEVELHRVYNFSIVIRVVPNGTSPVMFKPYFSVVLFNETFGSSGTSGTSTTKPGDMLPPHLTYAAASQNISLAWYYSLNYGKHAVFNQIKTKQFSAPVAFFSGTPITGTAPLTITFTDNSTNTPTTWSWTFGDGNTTNATMQNPVHTYMSTGSYNVSLNVTNPFGFNNVTKTSYIVVSPYPPMMIGVVRASHDWFLDYNGNGTWDGNVTDRQYALGKAGDIPVVGDWNGNGKTEIGVFRDNHTWNVDYNGNGVWDGIAGGDRIYITGKPGDVPVPGDWNGDKITEMAVFRGNHTWYIDYNGNGVWDSPAGGDRIYITGKPGDVPVPGDWNGDGVTEMAVFRGSHTWYIDYNGNGVWDSPVGGDRIYTTGQPGDIPVYGDWNGDRLFEMGVFRPSNHNFYLDANANGLWDGASIDKRYDFGTFGDIPVSGKW
jgi:PKD repeat protein